VRKPKSRLIHHLKYLWYLLKHKWFVFVAGRSLGVGLWQLLVHDLSKFGRKEWGGYVRYFFSRKDEFLKGRLDPTVVMSDFDSAWNHHQKVNPHHWQYWVLVTDNKADPIRTLEIPEKYVREMLADWMGAGRGKTGSWDMEGWVAENAPNMLFHPNTADLVHDILNVELGMPKAAEAVFMAHCGRLPNA
jgi:hypothetical protein